jgi:hypothetical protein
MARSILDIVIRTIKQGGAEVETIKHLVSIKSAILDAAAVAGTFVAAGFAVKKILDESVGTLVQYADQVRNVQNATGTSAEDASKLIQVLDDQKISYEQLEKAISKSGKAYDFSIEGIARMSDEYLTLKDSQAQASFAQERFGKEWISFVPVMKQGGQAIRDSADAVADNLVLTQKAVDQAREYEIGIDNLSDSFQGLKISMGKNLIGPTNQVVDGFNVLIRANEIAKDKIQGGMLSMEDWNAALDQATMEVAQNKLALVQHAQIVAQNTEDEKANAEAVKATTAAHQSMLGLIGNIASETRNYGEKQAELTTKMQENRAEAEKLYPWQKQQLDELNQKYADMQTTYDENAAAHAQAMGKIQYDLFITKLSAGEFTDAEYNMAQQAGLMFGVFDQQSVEAARNMDLVAQAVADGRIKVEDMGKAINMLPRLKNIDIVINAIAHVTGALAGPNAQAQAGGYGYQAFHAQSYASGGISSGPESGHWELLHGQEAVIPLQNGSVPVQVMGSPSVAGGDNFYVTLTISSPMTVLNEQTARSMLLPYIIDGIRQAKAQGAIK